jgi:hypothetical protein
MGMIILTFGMVLEGAHLQFDCCKNAPTTHNFLDTITGKAKVTTQMGTAQVTTMQTYGPVLSIPAHTDCAGVHHAVTYMKPNGQMAGHSWGYDPTYFVSPIYFQASIEVWAYAKHTHACAAPNSAHQYFDVTQYEYGYRAGWTMGPYI